jgi:hypothetical protein
VLAEGDRERRLERREEPAARAQRARGGDGDDHPGGFHTVDQRGPRPDISAVAQARRAARR